MVQFCYLRLYLGTKTVFLSFVATDGKDGHRWKREKVKPTLLACKHHQQIITVGAPWLNLFDIFLLTLQEHVVYV